METPKTKPPAPSQDMFLHNNPYGFKLNVYHPSLHPLYERYKNSKGLSKRYPVGDAERIEFENYIFAYWRKNYKFTGNEGRTIETEKST